MVLTIKNFSNPVWPWIVETAPTNLVWVAGTLKATLTWTSATGESWVLWTEEKLVRKEWSAPSWSMDWTTVATITTKDTYATNWYEDTGLSSETTYYYGVFAVYDNGTERGITTSVTTNVMTTATIKWNEVSNSEDFFLEYLDDADGGVQWSTEFDKFFEYKPVLLSTAWVETAELNPNDFSKDKNGNNVNITSWDNVMIKFPTLWVKMEKSGNTVTLSLTKELNKTWYQYYAHQTGSLSSPWAVQSAFYLWAYDAYNNWWTLKSWSWQSPTTSQTQANFCTLAKANGTGYNIIGWYQRQFVNALYMMKYWNPNSQSVIGQGYTWWSSKQNTGATNTVWMTWATNTSSTGRIKLFWLEDRRGNISAFIGWIYTSSRNIYVQLSWYSWNTSGGESIGIVLPSLLWNITSVHANNKWMFAPSSVSETAYTTHYGDAAYVNSSYSLIECGDSWSGSLGAGAFFTSADIPTSRLEEYLGSRLQYLPTS